MLSGGAAGAASSVFVYSLDYARTRLTSDSGNHLQKRQFNGLSDVYRKTIHSDGILGLYRGFRASVLGIILYRGLYFGIYDSVKPVVLVGALQVKTTSLDIQLSFDATKALTNMMFCKNTHTDTHTCADKKEERGREMSKWLTFRLSVHEGG